MATESDGLPEPEAARRPIIAVLDLLGRRWALRLVWELRRDALPFSGLRESLGVSPSVLSQRLDELESADLVERDPRRRYRLTAPGRELARVLFELNRWAEREHRSQAGIG